MAVISNEKDGQGNEFWQQSLKEITSGPEFKETRKAVLKMMKPKKGTKMAKTKPEETDKKTLELIQLVNQQKAEISKAEKANWKTNCTFSYIEDRPNDSINLHVANIKTLISIASFLKDKEDSYKVAATTLGVDSAPQFTWCGFPTADWLEDLKMRVTKIQIATKKKKLEMLEARLNAVISPQLRAQLEIQDIENQLNSGY